MGAEPAYVGIIVGETVGALLGEADGIGVGRPPLYVGHGVGSSVGGLVVGANEGYV